MEQLPLSKIIDQASSKLWNYAMPVFYDDLSRTNFRIFASPSTQLNDEDPIVEFNCQVEILNLIFQNLNATEKKSFLRM
jgi:hypothetical protein